MITPEQHKYKKVFSIIAGTMLLLAVPPIWPYAYYQFLRWAVTGAAIFVAYSAYQAKKEKWKWIMVAIAILFNPIAPFYLSKEVWVVIDIVVAALFFVSIKTTKKT